MRVFVTVFGFLLAVVSCTNRGDDFSAINHSFSRPEDAVVRHIDLDLKVDFDNERISGKATLRIDNLTGTRRLLLDAYKMKIYRVTLGNTEDDTRFVLGNEQGFLGQALAIDIGSNTEIVTVHYETTSQASAIDWLKPEQTAGGKKPFLFTQGQAILNRSWIPCQDTPGVRITYNARITTNPGLLAVMSASNTTRANASGVYEFEMPQPIPPYLIALAVGDLEFRAISERCGVYAERGVADRAAWEFADTEDMMRKAEALYGPYRWERYDIIVLPPSFPFGGMENPRLSFVTPVLLAGDRSLVSTIAHELAHSWSGNLVTNATWADFWLNEGFTTYFERRITELISGREQMEMQALLGHRELLDAIEGAGADAEGTALRPDTQVRNPDDGLSTVAYEKGYLFLRLVEEAVGRERWDAFLRGYFDTFAFQTMTTAHFLDYLRAELIRGEAELEKQLRIDEWVYGNGIPDNCPRIQSEAFERVKAQVAAWKTGTPAAALQTEHWSTQEWKQFLQDLPPEMTHAQMADLDDEFHFTEGSNGELLQVWFLHAIANRYDRAYPHIESYLVGIGRIWLIGPVYRGLMQTPEGMAMARAIYEKARPGYHKIATGFIDRMLQEDG